MNVGALKDDIDELVRTIEDKARQMHNEIFEEPGAQKFKPEIELHRKALKAYDSLLRGVIPMMKDISERINANRPSYEFSIRVLRQSLRHLSKAELPPIEDDDDSMEAVYLEQYNAFIEEVTTSGQEILTSLEAAVRGGGRRKSRRRRRRMSRNNKTK
jgi:hypothetical protein